MHLITFEKFDPNLDNCFCRSESQGIHFRINATGQESSLELESLKNLKLDFQHKESRDHILDEIEIEIKSHAQEQGKTSSICITMFCDFKNFSSKYEKFCLEIAKKIKKLPHTKTSLILSLEGTHQIGNLPKEYKKHFDIIEPFYLDAIRQEHPQMNDTALSNAVREKKMIYSYMADHLLRSKGNFPLNILGYTSLGILRSENSEGTMIDGVRNLCENLKRETSQRNIDQHYEVEYHFFILPYTQSQSPAGDLDTVKTVIQQEMKSNHVFGSKSFLEFDEFEGNDNIWVSIIAIEKHRNVVDYEHRYHQPQKETSFATGVLDKDVEKAEQELSVLYGRKEISGETYQNAVEKVNRASTSVEIHEIIRNQKGNAPVSLLD